MVFRRKKLPSPTRQRTVSTSRMTQPVFSYHTQRAEQPTEQIRQRDRGEAAQTTRRTTVRSYVWQRGGLLILLLAAAILLLSSLSLDSNPRLVLLSGGRGQYQLHTLAAYQQGAASILAGSVWNHTKLTINTVTVGTELQQKFPELSKVNIVLPFLSHRPVIYVQLAEPALILTSEGGGVVLDENGKVLMPATQLASTSQLNLPTVSNQTGLQPTIGKAALTSNQVQFIQTIRAELTSHQLVIASMGLTAGGNELDVHIKDQPYFTKFNTQTSLDDARQQAGTFLAVWNKLQSENITPTQYIDVRVDGRAYYK